jgi:hypothetical protein
VIPGFIITYLTFPGVIVHELAHALFCRLFGIPIYQVKFFQIVLIRGMPAGYVVHGPAKQPWHGVMVSIGPFFVNTILGALIASPGAIPILRFGSKSPLDYFFAWLGISIAMHAFPSTGDAASIWKTIHRPGVPALTKLISYPLVGLIYVGALGSMFWLDALYGLAVAGFLPNALVQLLA